MVRQLLAQGLLQVQGEYSVVALTDGGGEVLAGKREVLLRREQERVRTRSKRAAKTAPVDLDDEGQALFQRLRSWRAETAKEQAVPAYVVFSDATLAGIAQARPTSLPDLRGVSGVGEAKLERYGEAVLAVVGG